MIQRGSFFESVPRTKSAGVSQRESKTPMSGALSRNSKGCQRRSKTARFAPVENCALLAGLFCGDYLLLFVFEPVGVSFDTQLA